eukprot:15467889-Alexandrium_andersonii.AAC.1
MEGCVLRHVSPKCRISRRSMAESVLEALLGRVRGSGAAPRRRLTIIAGMWLSISHHCEHDWRFS